MTAGGGATAWPDLPPDATAAQVVQRQLDTYNARDIDAFMAVWADDARIYAHPDTVMATGWGEIRQRHLTRFAEPNLHARLVNRLTLGDQISGGMVVDQEVVTRTFPDGPGRVEVIGIYEVVDGRITKAWFKLGTPVLDP